MTSPAPTHICWIDLETTDTDPRRPHAYILEVGVIVTRHEPELTEVGRARMVIKVPGSQPDHDLVYGRMDPFVQRMHTENGLWAEATVGGEGWDISDADRQLAGWVSNTVRGDDGIMPCPIAGSGVAHLDRPFVIGHMPILSAQISYWLLDVGVQRRLLELAGRGDLVDMATDVDAKPHRALGDVELHVAEARRYLQLLGTIPVTAPAEPASH
jgi:oligoribonuclease (3'-5' exoribonuclease)